MHFTVRNLNNLVCCYLKMYVCMYNSLCSRPIKMEYSIQKASTSV